ncbi:MAG: hypothetical protein JXR37_24160 [Kiritimatiellae bacterium]|nr:hypothetical protein [Kiritimatiellia bacterium]
MEDGTEMARCRWRVLNMADIAACPAVFEPLATVAEVVSLPAEPSRLVSAIGGCDAYFASLRVRVDAEVLERAARLRVIATPSTGLDHIDMARAETRGITVLSLKDDTEFLAGITATAEMAWALLLATVRRLPWSFAAARRGEWARDRFRGHQLSGKTLGILGYGRLGRMVARYGKAFGMHVLACDTRDVRPEAGVRIVDFDTWLRESDVLSIHIHLTAGNRHVIDAAAFAKMKEGAVLVNTSRGAVLDEAALLDALRSGRLGGAGVDVIDGEWSDTLADHPLIRYANASENLVISPHTGGVTFESQRMAYERMVGKLREFLAKEA